MDPDVLKMAEMAGVFVAALASLAGIMIVFATISRVIKRTVRDTPDVPKALDDQRLQHLEQAVDTIALEVERISESQRFVSKLLSERAAEPEKIGRG